MKRFILFSALGGAGMLAAGFWLLMGEPSRPCEPPPCVHEPAASPRDVSIPPPLPDRLPLVEAASPDESPPAATSEPDTSDHASAPAKAATRSAAWEALRTQIDARLALLDDSRPRTNSVAFTDALKRGGIEVATLTDREVAELFDGFSRLATWKLEELAPWTEERPDALERGERDQSAVEERYRLCEQDLLRSFVRQ